MTPREMDAYIAERVMKSGKMVGRFVEAVDPELGELRIATELAYPRYTENMTDAWPVFEWLLEHHPWINVFDGQATIRLQLENKTRKPAVQVLNYPKSIWYTADTFPMAICKAAVAACEEAQRLKNNG